MFGGRSRFWKTCMLPLLILVYTKTVQAATLTSPSKVVFAVNNDAFLEWLFDNLAGQKVQSIELGVMDSTEEKLFDVQASGSGSAFPIMPWPSTFAWYQNRISWAGDLNSKKIIFKITNSTLKDSNKFYCKTGWINPIETKVNTINLLIVEPPSIYKPVFKNPYVEGNSTSVVCNATGTPTPTVTWVQGPSSQIPKSGEGSVTLFFNPISKKDAGYYRCKANNTGGTKQTDLLELVVHYKPSIIQSTKSIFEVYKDEKNKLVCTADGNPSPTFTWKKGTEKIENSNGMITTKQTQNGASSNLTLQSVSENSSGVEYVCIATNTQGSAAKTIVLKFAGTERPTTATTPGGGEPGAGKRSSDSALIGGAVGGSLALILIVVIIIIIIKCRKGRRGSRGYQGRGGYKERGTKSVSDIDDYEPVTKNNELPQYATVDRSKKTPKKSDLNYAELDHQNQSERSVDARPAKRNNEPTTYAEIVQTWEPTNERTYANVPRRGLNSSEML